MAKDSAFIRCDCIATPANSAELARSPEGWGLPDVSTSRRNSRWPAVSEIRPSQSYKLNLSPAIFYIKITAKNLLTENAVQLHLAHHNSSEKPAHISWITRILYRLQQWRRPVTS